MGQMSLFRPHFVFVCGPIRPNPVTLFVWSVRHDRAISAHANRHIAPDGAGTTSLREGCANMTTNRVTTTKTLAALAIVGGLLLAGCGGSDDGGTSADPDVSPNTADAAGDEATNSSAGNDDSGDNSAGDPAPPVEAAPSSGGSLLLGGEEVAMEGLLCYFQEQPRAGLGGVFTHTAQAEGTNASGEPVLLDTTRAVADDGTVEFDLTVGVGDFRDGNYVEYFGSGDPVFGDNSVSASMDVDDFESGPVALSFDLQCR
jgi:hypothetical protein